MKQDCQRRFIRHSLKKKVYINIHIFQSCTMIDQCLFTLSEIDIFFQSQNVIYTYEHDVILML